MKRLGILLGIVASAAIVAVVVAFGAAFLAHEFLVLKVGQDGIAAIDDTPLMFALVAGVYAAGGLAGLAVLVVGWRRFLRRRTG